MIDRLTSAATANQETHIRAANAAAIGGAVSNSPNPNSGHIPNAWTIRSSHRKKA